tara:strand:- start:135 stop:314 length:180 start_codon:yes stop_codon:yes gene_type:complete
MWKKTMLNEARAIPNGSNPFKKVAIEIKTIKMHHAFKRDIKFFLSKKIKLTRIGIIILD